MILDSFRVTDRVAIVTGGGRGIGRAVLAPTRSGYGAIVNITLAISHVVDSGFVPGGLCYT